MLTFKKWNYKRNKRVALNNNDMPLNTKNKQLK